MTNSAVKAVFPAHQGNICFYVTQCKRTVHILTFQNKKDIMKSSGDAVHQLLHRAVVAFLQHLETLLADTQAAEHAAVTDLHIELLTGHARHWTPRILCHGHRAVLLITCEVDLVQCRRNGFYLRWDKRRGGQLFPWQFWH